MSYLALLLAFKIGVTAIAVSAPLLLLPRGALAARTGAGAEAAPWLRLYGVAVSALLVGYASGFWTLATGAFPWGVVIMGIVSNACAAAAMIATGVVRRAPVLGFVLAAIAVGLIAAAAAPDVAMTRVW